MTSLSALRRKSTLLRLPALAGLLVAGGCGTSPPGAEPSPDETLVWADEFEGPAGRLPDSDRWQFDLGTGWGNAQLEYTTDRAENASLDGDGHLALTARRESYRGQPYTGARIKTKDRFEKAYGRFEARIRLPVGQGIWPAFWMLGADFDEVGWPATGEIDIMEFRGQEPTILHGSLHGPGYSGGRAVTRRFETGRRLDTDFHVYAVEWTVDRIRWFLDGELYHEVHRTDLPGEWVFDDPFFMLLNVAVGGGFVGPPDATTTFPQTMLVDWVRVYEIDP